MARPVITRRDTIMHHRRRTNKADLSLDILSPLFSILRLFTICIGSGSRQVRSQHSRFSRSHGDTGLVRARGLLAGGDMVAVASRTVVPSSASAASSSATSVLVVAVSVPTSGSVCVGVVVAVALAVPTSTSSSAPVPTAITVWFERCVCWC